MKFQIGDLCQILNTANARDDFVGLLCTVTSELVTNGKTTEQGHTIKVHGHAPSSHHTGFFFGKLIELRKIYDGNRKISWPECVWKPDMKLIDFLDVMAKESDGNTRL